jgi:hypothetical protein
MLSYCRPSAARPPLRRPYAATAIVDYNTERDMPGVKHGCLAGESGALARACCMLWHFLFPAILVYRSFTIYCFPCLLSYAIGTCGRAWLAMGKFCCCCLNCKCTRRLGCCICLRYEDSKDFPAAASSVGPWKGRSAAEVDQLIEWKRGDEVCAVPDGDHARLFSGKIEPADIGQGQLGDCWLMTSLACLAEFPGAVQHVFLTDEYNPRGRYVLQLCERRMPCLRSAATRHPPASYVAPVQPG